LQTQGERSAKKMKLRRCPSLHHSRWYVIVTRCFDVGSKLVSFVQLVKQLHNCVHYTDFVLSERQHSRASVGVELFHVISQLTFLLKLSQWSIFVIWGCIVILGRHASGLYNTTQTPFRPPLEGFLASGFRHYYSFILVRGGDVVTSHVLWQWTFLQTQTERRAKRMKVIKSPSPYLFRWYVVVTTGALSL